MLPLTVLPFYFDLMENPNWYANQHLDAYYGLHSIRLAPGLGLADAERNKYETPVRFESPNTFRDFKHARCRGMDGDLGQE